ncbi:MAG: hypothetical protein QM726_17810 [Chitinophagaceae bacterium]
MKTFYCIGFICILFAACNKDNNSAQNKVVGNWELRTSIGGIAGTINYPAGNGNIYTFYSDGTYHYGFDNLARTGTYTLTPVANRNTWMLELHYNVNNQPVNSMDSVSIDNSKLIFIARETCCDMPTITYEKLGK